MLHAFQPGQTLLDKYRVERVLGAGGMGVVIAARHLALDELVAIKFMLGGGKPADLTRFVREARAAVRLKSQHVARVLDVAALEDGTPYMVLEHLDGSDLSHVVRERGPLPVVEAVDAVLQACEAIAEAHSIGIVHRDIKPANLFLTRGADGSPCIKVLDFGIAKWTNASTAKMEPSQPMGSAPYMAPEQFAATNLVDSRADGWALGATLFHLLTGKAPFHHDDVDSIQAMMHAVLHRPPMRLRALRPNGSEQLEAVLLQCLEKDRAARFQSVAALAAALAPFGSEQAALYAKRVAKVLGEAEPSVRDAAPALEARTAPLPLLAGVTMPLPQDVRASERAATENVTTARRTNHRTFVGALVVTTAFALGGVLVGMRLGGGSAQTNDAANLSRTKDPTPIETSREQVTTAPVVPPLPSASTSSVAVDTPTRAEVAPSVVTTRGSAAPALRPLHALPAATSSTVSPPPKESLYGRRR
ncbi:MAG: protein kinase [Polyangiaceae bacterium]|nr:protein kinase [Polyangiaceae bacterium]